MKEIRRGLCSLLALGVFTFLGFQSTPPAHADTEVPMTVKACWYGGGGGFGGCSEWEWRTCTTVQDCFPPE